MWSDLGQALVHLTGGAEIVAEQIRMDKASEDFQAVDEA
jgi:hypothetical protein